MNHAGHDLPCSRWRRISASDNGPGEGANGEPVPLGDGDEDEARALMDSRLRSLAIPARSSKACRQVFKCLHGIVRFE
jgi:hypothetical protein